MIHQSVGHKKCHLWNYEVWNNIIEQYYNIIENTEPKINDSKNHKHIIHIYI